MGHIGMIDIQAVNEVDFKSTGSEISGHIKKTEGFRPEVIGGKIVNPGINENERRAHDLYIGFSKC
jgi:hypothetical protein